MDAKWSSLGSVLIGVGLMFLLDPASGAQRRRVMKHRASSMMRRARDRAKQKSRDLANRARGLAHEMNSSVSHQELRTTSEEGRMTSETDRVLSERVRSKLGHLVRNAREIDVRVDDGRVALSGAADPDRVDRLIAEISCIPGVRNVESLLESNARPRRDERPVNRLRRVLQRVVTPRVGAVTTLSALLAAYGWSRLHAARSGRAPARPLAGEIGF